MPAADIARESAERRSIHRGCRSRHDCHVYMRSVAVDLSAGHHGQEQDRSKVAMSDVWNGELKARAIVLSSFFQTGRIVLFMQTVGGFRSRLLPESFFVL